MSEIGLSLSSNPQMPYAIRAWAVRDLVIAILILVADKTSVKVLLIACVAIDFIDIISAYLSIRDGLFDSLDAGLIELTATAIAALILELGAIAILFRQKMIEDKH